MLDAQERRKKATGISSPPVHGAIADLNVPRINYCWVLPQPRRLKSGVQLSAGLA